MENSGRLTLVRLQQPQERRHPFLTVRAVFSCVQTKVWLPMLGIFNVRADVNACDCTRGFTNTVRESALKVDSGREKKSCRTGESNQGQLRVGPTLYRLSYIPVVLSPERGPFVDAWDFGVDCALSWIFISLSIHPLTHLIWIIAPRSDSRLDTQCNRSRLFNVQFGSVP